MTKSAVELNGFEGWVRFADLPDADVPRAPGVYVVMRPSAALPTFLETSPAGWHKGMDPTTAVDELARSWVPGEPIVYIGKANMGRNSNRGLRKRLSEYRRFGAGARAGHSGGRRIWQLADSADLLVGWRVTDDLDARRVEREMIARFRARHGVRPFANRAD
ncbi:MAG: hypothetical protein WBD41_16780 [Rhodococcus sp. (in: high G+C Gram-positive bacteria)]|uniref:hypothetical protein n=1 Tax=Rhodococcus sp. EPR-157 TaxID=1813677 RepID=UPI0007BBF2B0|nr:hypothetical protein [Rhodococcus sp. EPR-157]KZF06498.1 hypothetical protein A2J03_24445 [Rhodococcus sp. EPR-157]